MKQLSKNQKKKILYSFASLFVIAIIAVASVFMFSDKLPDFIEQKKEIIVSGILTYGSGALLLAKTLSFIVGEFMKKRLSNSEKIEEYLTKDLPKNVEKNVEKLVENKGENMRKTQPIVGISGTYVFQGYKFTVNEKKGIHISWDGDFDYEKFKYANGEFVEQIRKIKQNA